MSVEASGRPSMNISSSVRGPEAAQLAARLAEAGRKVLLLEAGGDPLQIAETRLPGDYQVPAFHAFASEIRR